MSKWGALHSEQLSRIQQAAVTHLSLNTYIPQVTQFDQADITELEALRNQLKDGYKKQGVSLTILAFIAKAVAHLLLQEQRFNSHLADDGKSLIIRDEVHLGIAVATEDGLIVPVLRRPEQKGIRQIAEELQMLGQKARDKKLSPADLAGASFTISSLGNLGGTGFTPLVSWPQVAILGISPAAMQPMWDGSAFVPRLMLPLSLSYDHRVINGADAARFARRLAELLADLRQVLL
jgi:pyruvate dehydrogenase E2 component (dihydrolipoamide acetyltransferase)